MVWAGQSLFISGSNAPALQELLMQDWWMVPSLMFWNQALSITLQAKGLYP